MSESEANASATYVVSKVPRVTVAFWAIKILATTLGETGGDAVSMTLQVGYALSTLVFLAFLAVALLFQLRSRSYHPAVYWAVVVATTTVGTTASDYFDRTVGLGYVRSSAVLFCLVVAVLVAWRRTMGAISVDPVLTTADEAFYWVTITVSNTLGTALGDFTATTLGLGFEGGALVFAGLIAVVATIHVFSGRAPSLLFWAAYVLTRPLGATLGDTLTKPIADGGLNLGRVMSSLVIAGTMVVAIAATSAFERRGARR